MLFKVNCSLIVVINIGVNFFHVRCAVTEHIEILKNMYSELEPH